MSTSDCFMVLQARNQLMRRTACSYIFRGRRSISLASLNSCNNNPFALDIVFSQWILQKVSFNNLCYIYLAVLFNNIGMLNISSSAFQQYRYVEYILIGRNNFMRSSSYCNLLFCWNNGGIKYIY